MFAWSAALKYTGIRLELICDYEKHLFIKQGICGGISACSHRFAKANNPYLENYVPNMEISYIAYWDCNSLYATAMCEPLHIGDFSWLNRDKIDSFELMSIAPDANYGYFLEVDLEYPQELHDLHNDYPLCSQQFTVKGDIQSE